MILTKLIKTFVPTVAALATVTTATAGTTSVASGKGAPEKMTDAKAQDACSELWSLATLYKNDSGFFNELAFTGRYHGQYYAADGPDGTDDDWDNRRFRLGLKALLLDKALELKAEIFSDLNSGGEFYEGFTDLHLAYKISDSLTLTVGKQKPKFGQEWSTSSRLIPTFERGLLTNSFKPDYATGVSLAGKSGATSYYLGGFANDPDEEFGNFDGGWSVIAGVDQDIKDIVGTDKASVGFGYIHSDRNESDTIFTSIDDGLSLRGSIKQGALGVSAEALYLMGDNDRYGISITPTYDITKQLQFVARYQLAASDSDSGLGAQKRYEKTVGVGSGDLYNAVYAGLQYFICEDKLKLMTGVEWSDLDGGGDSWTYFAGIRAYW